MSNNLMLSSDDLADNPTARVPICLCLDTSGSMSGDPINELNDGVKLFFDSILSDDVAQWAAEICIVTFGDRAKVELDFADIHKQSPPVLYASGSTPMGEAVNLALDLLENRKRVYSDSGVDYYQPWIVVMTDGAPTDSIDSAAARCCEMVNKKKLVMFPIGIGSGADMNTLQRFSPNRKPLKLKGLNFKEFFEWLSKSVSRTSMSIPGEKVELLSAAGWGEL